MNSTTATTCTIVRVYTYVLRFSGSRLYYYNNILFSQSRGRDGTRRNRVLYTLCTCIMSRHAPTDSAMVLGIERTHDNTSLSTQLWGCPINCKVVCECFFRTPCLRIQYIYCSVRRTTDIVNTQRQKM